MSQYRVTSNERTAVAVRMTEPPDADGFPTSSSWDLSRALRFNADWQGRNADPERDTEVRLLGTPEWLFLRFLARFLSITGLAEAVANGRRAMLVVRDDRNVIL